MNKPDYHSPGYRTLRYKEAGFTSEQTARALETIPQKLDTEVVRRMYLHKIWAKRRKFPKNKRFIRGW